MAFHRTSGSSRFRHVAAAFLCVACIGNTILPNVAAEDKDDTSPLSALEILLRLYDNALGTRWDNHTNWLTDPNPCNWHGITCYDDTESDQRRVGHIQQIDLSENHLVGSVPDEIFDLPYIESIILSTNPDLNISFKNLAAAQHLERLVVSSTTIASIEGISAATGLKELHITSLGLSGPLPMELFQLTNLEGIYSNFNGFTGPLPSEIGLLTNLQEIYLYENDFTGQIPSEIGQLENLRILAMAQNAFGGTLPTELNKCTDLNIIALQRDATAPKGEGISGPLPTFGDLTNINEMYFQNQKLSGEIPTNFLKSASPTDAIRVDLSGNQLTADVPTTLSGLKQLTLMLQDNKIAAVSTDLCSNVPDWFGGNVGNLGCDAFLCPPQSFASTGRQTMTEACQVCPTAEFFGATSCDGAAGSKANSGAILINFYNAMGGQFWKNNNDWLDLGVDHCSWEGIECDSTGAISAIKLKNNGLQGTVPTDIFSLPELRVLDLNSNSLVFSFQGIENAANLEVLDLTHSDLSSLAGIRGLASTKIRNLKLASNDVKGIVPEGVFSLLTLEELDLSHNKFSGVFPSEFGLLTNLKRLHCYGNVFNGVIPTELGNLVNLLELVSRGKRLHWYHSYGVEQLDGSRVSGASPDYFVEWSQWTASAVPQSCPVDCASAECE